MKFVMFFAILGFSAAAQAQSCDFSNPHSFACQHATFSGGVFPLVRVNTGALNRTWFANQFTPGSSAGADMFSTVRSQTNATRTCFVRNFDGSRVGSLRIQSSARGIRGASFSNFRAENFTTNQPGGFEDSQTAVFANTRTDQIFKCRIFQRAGTNHLTCQYFEDREFIGYLGFLPFQQDCR